VTAGFSLFLGFSVEDHV